jgi:hypothetical protein
MSAGEASKAAYWRTFGSAYAAYSVGNVVGIGLAAGSVGDVVGALIFGLAVFGVWAALAPRGAAIGLLVLCAVNALGVLLAVILTRNNLASAIVIPFDLVAGVFAVRSLPIASSYREARREQDRREREYERQERWRAGSGW